jgi:hypothetical protein
MPISLSGSLNLSGSLTTTGTITATTLVVETITSSISSITGSTNFGSLLTDTHKFTGSLNVTGSLSVVTTGTEFQVTSTGVKIGNVSTDSHVLTGSMAVTGGLVDINKDGQSLRIWPQSSSGSARIQLQNSGSGGLAGANAIIAVESSTGADQFSGTSPFSLVIGTATQKAFHLGANSAVVMTITGSNVGIGSATANYLLDVNKTVAGDFVARILNESSTGYGLYIQTNDNSKPAIRIANSSGTATIDLKAQASQVAISNGGTAQEASFRATMSYPDGYRAALYLNNTHTGGAEYYIVSTNNSDGIWGGGKLAISGNNGGNGVYLNGVTATTWTGQSDIRLKDIDSEIENAIDKVNKLRGVRFTWKSDETKKMQVGLIAQEVKEVLPEAVDFEEGNDDYRMGVQYTEIIPLLINAIKELTARVQYLENK